MCVHLVEQSSLEVGCIVGGCTLHLLPTLDATFESFVARMALLAATIEEKGRCIFNVVTILTLYLCKEKLWKLPSNE